jgi:hypothetical protein
MPFPFTVSESITAGGVGPEDVPKLAEWLDGELRRAHATDTSFAHGRLRFKSLMTIGGPLRGIGGGVIDFREAGSSGKIRVRLSFVPLAIVIAAGVTLAVASTHARESWVETVGAWAGLFGLIFVPSYLILPERFCGFLEQCIKRYYQSPQARRDPTPPQST